MPPVAPSVSARSEAMAPSMPQKHSDGLGANAVAANQRRRTISRWQWVQRRLRLRQRVDQLQPRPGAAARPTMRRHGLPPATAGSHSRSSLGAKLAWPPSVPSVTQRSPLGIRPETPRPVPGPIKPDHAVALRLAAADLMAASAPRRQRHRQRGEVVHHQQRGELELALRCTGWKARRGWSWRPGRLRSGWRAPTVARHWHHSERRAAE